MNLVVIPTHVVNEEKKAMKGGERCSFLLDAFTRGGGRGKGGDDLLHFSPVLPPLMAPPELRKGSSIQVFLVLTVIKRGESSLAVINRFLQSSIFS